MLPDTAAAVVGVAAFAALLVAVARPRACSRRGATCGRWSRLPRVLRDLVKRALGAAGRTGVGKNLVNAAVLADPGLKRYPSVERWPESLDGFEDLAFLFSSNQLSHGIASLQLDEAALLYRLARARRRPARRSPRSAASRAAAR